MDACGEFEVLRIETHDTLSHWLTVETQNLNNLK